MVPPEDVSGLDLMSVPWKTEHDVIVTLREMGHEVHTIGVGDDLAVVRRAVQEWKPEIVFNMMEAFHELGTFDHNVVSYLELLRVPYTGSNPRGLMLARDKALSKELLAYHRIRVPRFAVFPVGKKVRRPAKLPFPLVVKSLFDEASLGISQASVVTSDEKLRERVEFMHQTFDVDVIAEEYVEGRELYVGVVGNERLHTFPIWELSLDNLPDGAPRIATSKVKFDVKYQKKYDITSQRAENLPDGCAEHVAKMCARMYRVLKLTGYARMDLRLTPDGKVYCLEANPNPDLREDEDLSRSAQAENVAYLELLQRIVNLGLNYRAAWDTAG
jgi:D-alanine-D-alanine ligase